MGCSYISLLLFCLFCLILSVDGVKSDKIEERKDPRKRLVEERKRRQEELHESFIRQLGEPLIEERPTREDRPVSHVRESEQTNMVPSVLSGDQVDIAAPLGDDDDGLLSEIPEPPVSLLRSIPVEGSLSSALNGAVTSFTKIRSIPSMTVANLDGAVSASVNLLQSLSGAIVSNENDKFGEKEIGEFHSAISSLIELINSNGILPGFKLESQDSDLNIVIRNELSGVVTPIGEVNTTEIAKFLSDGVNGILDQVGL